MNNEIVREISLSLKVPEKGVIAVLGLLDEGSTIPFIARYRKEATGNLDEEVISEINKVYISQVNLKERKDAVIRLIEEKGLLTEELKNKILACTKQIEVEDLYLPFKEKKQTKATKAIAKGLEPLARLMLTFPKDVIFAEQAKFYISEEKEVASVKEALEGAEDIISEIISDDAEYRKYLREQIQEHGTISSTLKKNAVDEKKTYEIYYNFSSLLYKLKPHQILAFNRGEKEKILNVSVEYEFSAIQEYLEREVIKNLESDACEYVKVAISEAIKRLIYPSLEREIRNELTDISEDQAILVFSDNLKHLLLQPPLKGKRVLGFDPAFRTGCKLSVIGVNGEFIAKDVIYPHEKAKGATADPALVSMARGKIKDLLTKYNIQIIAIGNGTASRESEKFIADILSVYNQGKDEPVKYLIVSEAGASVYSASELARQEFPDFSVEERSAASIARRVLDPLSELVKIEPKSIGVGQYQHDVDAKKLTQELTDVVVSAVNQVGVNVNTASKSLLTYISGLNKKTAESLVAYRIKNGEFKNRKELLSVPYITEKVFEQSAGFMRILDSEEWFDMTPIHPESYEIAHKICDLYKITPDLFGKPEIKEITKKINRKEVIQSLGVGEFTLNDIISALEAPLRDIRDDYPQPVLKEQILDIKDLAVGMELEGVVRNVVDFGAFIDIGLHADGLVHISRICKEFIRHPKEKLSVGDIVTCYVKDVNLEKEKVSLSLIKD